MEKYTKMIALLTPRQAKFIDKMKQEGYSKVEIIRRALDLFIEKQEKQTGQQGQ
jgi:hypothetical protein